MLLYVDVEVQIPAGHEGAFRNSVGALRARGVDGKLSFDASNADVALDAVHGTIGVDTGSGDIRVRASGLASFDADTGSGDISLDARDGALTVVRADTGSGDVTLVLGPEASFEVTADQGSGDLVSRYEDAKPILSGKELVGYRRGAAKAKIHVETGSGDVVLEPGS